MMLALFLAPMVATVLALAVCVPFMVLRMWARAEAPMQGEPMPGWALALDHELEASEWVDAIDTLWDDDDCDTLPSPVTLRSPIGLSYTEAIVVAMFEPTMSVAWHDSCALQDTCRALT